MTKEVNKFDKELKNFEEMSVSDDGQAWKIGPGKAKLHKNFMNTFSNDLATKNNKIKFVNY